MMTSHLFLVTAPCDSMRVQDALYADQVFQILTIEQPRGLRLVGQADVSHREILRQQLEQAAQPDSDLFIDMASLDVMDVGGMRLLLDIAVMLAVDGRKLVIGFPRPAVLRTLRICNWDNLGNLQIINDSQGDEREAG